MRLTSQRTNVFSIRDLGLKDPSSIIPLSNDGGGHSTAHGTALLIRRPIQARGGA
jgi:hypothetical protein